MNLIPLDWCLTDGGLHQATTPFGIYQIHLLPRGVVLSFICGPEWNAGHIRINESLSISLDEAKNLARQDFEHRVKLCFVA